MQKQIGSYIAIFLLLLNFTACNDPDTTPSDKIPYGDRTHIEGKVYEFETNKPLQNCLVELQEEFAPPFSGGGIFSPIDTTYSDSSGFYSFDFKHMKNDNQYLFSYRAEAQKLYYFPGFRNVESGYKEINKNIIIQPYAWMKLHIKNVKPFDDNDIGYVNYNGEWQHLIGRALDTTVIKRVRGYEKNTIVYYVTKNKLYSRYSDTLYIGGHDTIDYNIFY